MNHLAIAGGFTSARASAVVCCDWRAGPLVRTHEVICGLVSGPPASVRAGQRPSSKRASGLLKVSRIGQRPHNWPRVSGRQLKC